MSIPHEQPDESLVRLRVRPETVYVTKGRTVLATGPDGFLDSAPDQGLFVHQTRMLSRYRYLIEGRRLHPVSVSNVAQHSWLGYFIASTRSFTDREPAIAEIAQNCVELRLSRYVGEGFHEDADLTNFTQETVQFVLALELDADFADQGETRGERRQIGRLARRWSEGEKAWELSFAYTAHHTYDHQGEEGTASIKRGLRVRFSNTSTPPRHTERGIAFQVTLAPHEKWHCCLDFLPVLDERELVPTYRCRSFGPTANDYDSATRRFMSKATRFSSAESGTLSNVVVGSLEQAKRDLDALRLHDLDLSERGWTVAAGLPLYVALFGRDTLTAAWEAAPVTSEVMEGLPAYNPYSYHRGTVWPVEHGPFAIGAYRYGCHDYVERICRSQFETAAMFDFFRLPECIAGHQRGEDHPFPAVYPVANSPQAWSSTTVYTLLQAMLGLQPFAPLRMLFVDPFLPEWLPEITVSNLRVADAVVTLRFFRRKDGRSDYRVLEKRGRLHVIRQPSPWSLTAGYWERAKDILLSLAPGR
ncbi:glycogen debranching enzyme [Ensifer sp. WSM1721]|uniref:glycogen debranching N-terminal domain-containing protein n=1 Tax=Ensifer sp. WSM1721 TaxID=1041159 RepID=UPI001FD8A16D|nr:glycogen debranching N-terminal domain-containing protein [Ensifer sp. WSM1721]